MNEKSTVNKLKLFFCFGSMFVTVAIMSVLIIMNLRQHFGEDPHEPDGSCLLNA